MSEQTYSYETRTTPACECLITGVQLAKRLDVGGETIRQWRKRGLIPFIKINSRTIRYDWWDVVATLKAREPDA